MPKIPRTFGDHIQIKRFEKGLLQSQIAKELKVTTSGIKGWEKNSERPPQAQWLGLANLLGLSDGLYFNDQTAE
jgi:DNA-binding transcriptional regulator YiaG